jgi:serine/threonine protein kinase
VAQNLVGQMLLNRFRVDSFLASGGMGAVYRVWDLKRNVPLAMKILHAELAEDSSILKRFQREARALQKLAHPNIVPFYGLYQSEGLSFLLVQYIDGLTLKEILDQQHGRPCPPGESLTYLKAVCAALGYAHTNGVVHCDVKPGNVMVDRGGKVYLTDFGIARHAESTTTTLATMGTAAYMAPEQIRGDPVSPATDIYALGVMAFELLTGRRPFRGTEDGLEKEGTTSNERIQYAHLYLGPPQATTINPALSVGVGEVIDKALSKEPGSRFSNTQEFFGAICTAFDTKPLEIVERARLETINGALIPQVVNQTSTSNPSKIKLFSIIGGLLVVFILISIVWFSGDLHKRDNLTGVSMITQTSADILITPRQSIQTLSKSPTSVIYETPTVTFDSASIAKTPFSTNPRLPASTIYQISISASGYDQQGSKDSGGNPVTYEPDNVIDQDSSTAWRIKGNGSGEWLQLDFGRSVEVQEIGIIPGYAKIDPYDGTDRFKQNYVLHNIRLEFSDGSQLEHSFDYSRDMQFINVNDISTTYIRIVIISTYSPRSTDPREFTAISEIQVNGWWK